METATNNNRWKMKKECRIKIARDRSKYENKGWAGKNQACRIIALVTRHVKK